MHEAGADFTAIILSHSAAKFMVIQVLGIIFWYSVYMVRLLSLM
jgi:hypothetical protein